MTTVRFRPGYRRDLLTQPGVRRYLDDIAGDLEGDIERAAPRRAGGGRLAGSWRHGVAIDDRGLYGWVGTDSSFWHLPEYGTSQHPAQPYIRPQLRKRRG